MSFKNLFHYISYLQYPLMAIGMYFAIQPYLNGLDQIKNNPDMLFQSLNSVLLFMGLGISFSSLQDTSKTQNKLSQKIWEDPTKGKIMILLLGFTILFLIAFGLVGYYMVETGPFKDLSIGIIVLGLGLIGLLKAAVELFEHHRLDNSNKPITNHE